MKKLLWILGAVMLAGLAFMAVLPSLLSTPWARHQILSRVNADPSRHLQIDEWSLSWVAPTIIKGIVFEDLKTGVKADIAQIKNNQGLLSLIKSRYDVGETEIITPVVYFNLATQPADPATPSTAPPSQKPPPPAPAKEWPSLMGQIKVTNGSLYTVKQNTAPKIIAQDINWVINTGSDEKPIAYRFLMKSGDGSGRMAGAGTIALDPAAMAELAQAQADATLQIDNMELTDFLAIAASKGRIPNGQGRLSGNLQIKGSAARQMELKGHLDLPQLRLWGGPLKTDQPVIDTITAKLDAVYSGKALILNRFDFGSSWAEGSLDGRLSGADHYQINTQANVNLPEIAAHLPATLNLKKGIRLTEGQLQFRGRANAAGGTTAFSGDAQLKRLLGIQQGQTLAWNQPVSLSVSGQEGPEGLALDHFKFTSAFIQGEGKGDLKQAQLKIDADIKAALRELKKFVQTKGWDGIGQLNASLKVNQLTGRQHDAALNVSIQDFSLTRKRQEVITKQNVQLNLVAGFQKDASLAESQVDHLALELDSRIASGSLRTGQLQLESSSHLPSTQNFSYQGQVHLQQLSKLLLNLGLLPPPMRLSGQTRIKINGDLKGRRVVLRKALVDTQNLVFRQGQKVIRDKRLVVNTQGKIDMDKRAIRLVPLNIDFAPGEIRLQKLALADWSNLNQTLKTDGTANLSLARGATTFKAFMDLPKGSHIDGQSHLKLNMDFSSPQSQRIQLDATVSPFRFTSTNRPPISEKKVQLQADLSRHPAGSQYSFNNIRLTSSALSLAASGQMIQNQKERILELAGDLTPDLRKLTTLFLSPGNPRLEISGRAPKPFRLKIKSHPHHWKNALSRTDFNGTLYIDQLKGLGFDIKPGDVPIRIANQQATMTLRASANGGTLNLEPRIDLSQTPYRLSFPKNSSVLKNVQITNGMTANLLAPANPFISGSVLPGGLLNLDLQTFNWPLDKKRTDQIAFDAWLNLSNLKMAASPLMNRLLGVVGIQAQYLDIGNQDIRFTARNGRINSSPLQIMVDDHPLNLQGSIGFDRTINYIAQLPVTERLVGRDAYRFLKGVSIDVPIGGTVAKPRIDEQSMQKAVGSMVQQALQKNIERQAVDLLQQLLKPKQ
jgi:hypothetical protein